MKKLITAILAAVIALNLYACGRKDKDKTPGTEAPTGPDATLTDPTMDDILPDPTLEPNIPDPNVDPNSTENGSLIDDITDMTGEHNNG